MAFRGWILRWKAKLGLALIVGSMIGPLFFQCLNSLFLRSCSEKCWRPRRQTLLHFLSCVLLLGVDFCLLAGVEEDNFETLAGIAILSMASLLFPALATLAYCCAGAGSVWTATNRRLFRSGGGDGDGVNSTALGKSLDMDVERAAGAAVSAAVSVAAERLPDEPDEEGSEHSLTAPGVQGQALRSYTVHNVFTDLTAPILKTAMVFASVAVLMFSYVSYLAAEIQLDANTFKYWALAIPIQLAVFGTPSGDGMTEMGYWTSLMAMDKIHVTDADKGCHLEKPLRVRKVEVAARYTMSVLSNISTSIFIACTLPLLLMRASTGGEFVLNATAVTYIVKLDDLPEANTLTFSSPLSRLRASARRSAKGGKQTE